MSEPKFIATPVDRGMLLVFDEPQSCPKCRVMRCVWVRLNDGTTTCFLCTPPPLGGETTGTES